MQAYKSAATVDIDGEIRIQEVPFKPGSTVEVIVLEPVSRPLKLVGERIDLSKQEALDRTLSRSFSLGGQFPSRDALHER